MNLGRSAGDRLSGIEAAYLDAERPGFPVHVGAVATFEAGPLLDRGGELRLDVLRSHLTARLDRVPRLRRRIAAIPFGLDRPRWIDDVDFDLANHLDVVEAPAPGDDDALRHVAADTWSAALDRAHPLWRCGS